MTTQDETREAVQLAILASPRMGNTWLRALIRTAYDLSDFAAHGVDEIPWDALPPRSVINLHHPPSDPLRERLKGRRAIVIARHPLDTLISILHHASQHAASNGWAGGLGGNEDSIRGVTPVSQEFRDYVVGPRAAALFTVTTDWWNEPRVIRTSYEALIADTEGELRRLVDEIGVPSAVPIADAVAACAFDVMRLRSQSHTRHAWKGQPGLWKSLLPAPLARSIAEVHRPVFETLGYECEPDASLGETAALANWLNLEAETNKRDKEQLWGLIHEARRAETRAVAAQKAILSDYQARLAASETHRLDVVERFQTLLAERNEALERAKSHHVRLAGQLASKNARLVELGERLIDAKARREQVVEQFTRQAEVTQAHLQDARQQIERLTAEVARCEERLERARLDLAERDKQLKLANAQLAGTGHTGRAVARRLKRLSARLPGAASRAMRVVDVVRKMRRAA